MITVWNMGGRGRRSSLPEPRLERRGVQCSGSQAGTTRQWDATSLGTEMLCLTKTGRRITPCDHGASETGQYASLVRVIGRNYWSFVLYSRDTLWQLQLPPGIAGENVNYYLLLWRLMKLCHLFRAGLLFLVFTVREMRTVQSNDASVFPGFHSSAAHQKIPSVPVPPCPPPSKHQAHLGSMDNQKSLLFFPEQTVEARDKSVAALVARHRNV